MSDFRAARHLTVEELADYLNAGAPAMLLVPGSPDCYLLIDPPAGRLSIRLPHGPLAPDVSRYERFDLHTVYDGALEWFELSVTAKGEEQQAYTVLAAVLDHVQLEGESFERAVPDVLDSYRDLLARRSRMTEEQQLGLVAELLVLRFLISAVGEEQALEAWRGPMGEEHDFGFADFDVEVKATAAEARRHVIPSMTQLQPTPGRDLYLLSLQLTTAGAGAGYSLGDVIGTVRASLASKAVAFESSLRSLGWADEDSDLYERRYSLRTPPAAYLVDQDFPAITRERLQGCIPRLDLVVSLYYRVDVSNLAPATPPEPMTGLVSLQEDA